MQSQNNPTKIKYNRMTRWTKEIKNYFYLLRTKLTKAQTRKQNERKVPSGELSNENKTNKYVEKEGKEREERKNRYAKLNRGKWRRFIYIKD